MLKTIKKALRIFLWSVAWIVFSIGLLFLAIQTDSFQTWLAGIATNYLSKELDAKVSVGHVSIRFFNKAALKEVYVEDTKGDTLFWIDELVVNIGKLSTAEKRLAVSKLTVRNGFFNLLHTKGDEHDNLYFLLDYFSGDTARSDTANWKVTADELELEGFRFRYDDWNEPEEKYGVDFSHLYVYDVNGDFHGFHVENDSIFAKVDRLSFKEKSGFSVKEFTADAKVSGSQIRTLGLKLKTDRSDISGDLTFDYTDWEDFDDFIHKVEWKGRFIDSDVYFKDIAYFTSELSGLDRQINIDGRFRGAVNRFKVNDLQLRWGKRSFLKGKVFFSGLPDLDKTTVDLKVTDAFTDVADIEWLPLPPFDSSKQVTLPENLRLMKEVGFKGGFVGLLDDFQAFGDFNTGLGYFSTRLFVFYDRTTKNYRYQGAVSAANFNLGSFTYTPHLGQSSFRLDVDGKGVRLNDVKASMTGQIERLNYYGYDYKDIKVDGSISKKKFTGQLETHGEDVDLAFKGNVDLSSSVPRFEFDARIERLQLNRIHLLKGEQQFTLRTSVFSDFTGNAIDNLEGDLEVSNTFLQIDQKMYHLNKVDLQSINLEGGFRRLKVVSDLVDADVNGAFQLQALPATFREIIPRYLPNVLLPVKGELKPQDFEFNVHFKNTALLSQIFLPELYIDPSTLLHGSVKGKEKDFDIRLSSDLVKYGDVRWEGLSSVFTTGDSSMAFRIAADSFYYSNTGVVPSFRLDGYVASNALAFHLKLADLEGQKSRLNWRGHMQFRSYDDFDLRIDTSKVIIDGLSWAFDTGNLIRVDSNGVRIKDISIHHESESLSVEGGISKDPQVPLSIDLRNFEIGHLNPMLHSSGVTIGGAMSGAVTLSDLYRSPVVKADLDVEKLIISGDTLGNLSLTTEFDKNERVLFVEAGIINGAAKVVDISGRYLLNDTENPLNFSVKTDNLYVHIFESYTTGIVSDLRGKMSAELAVNGSFDKPVVNGYVDLRKVSATVDYLNTRYNVTSRVVLKDNLIDLAGVKVYDQFGHEATVNGGIYHTNFSGFNLKLSVNARNLEALNTTVLQNSYYYGNAFVSGRAEFTGPLDDIAMKMTLSPEKNTKIKIPFNTATEVTTSDFITFVKSSKSADADTIVARISSQEFSLSLDLQMNSNAEIDLIFDEKIGDVISGSGNGNLKLEIANDGNFRMNGTYNIESGTYLFTLQNLINKKFKVEPGGTVSWNGDPYNARIDMAAVYTTSTASLYNLIQDSTFQRRVNVDCRLLLTGALMNPNIAYDINIKNQDATIESMVRTVLNSEQEINRQMFGLLVFNQFLPPSTSTSSAASFSAGAGAAASASEMLSNQVSNWLSQLSKDVNIGFNYRAKDSYSNEEVQLMFSKTMFNDRLLVETNVGVTGNTTAAASTNTNANSLVGEFYTEYKVSSDGRFRLKAYNRSNADDLINFNAPYTQGVGVFFRQDFSNWKDLKERLKAKKKTDKSEKDSELQ